MTKKDYVAIAAVLAGPYSSSDREGVRAVAERMADMLERDNPRFDRVRFLQACAAKVKE